MEKLNKERGQAAFTLKHRLQHAQVSHPTNSMPTTSQPLDSHGGDLEEDIEWFEVEGEGVHIFHANNPGSVGVLDNMISSEGDPCPSKSGTGNRKVKAQFGRCRTHNEQTLVRPCGIIFARATFFGAEAVSNVLVRS